MHSGARRWTQEWTRQPARGFTRLCKRVDSAVLPYFTVSIGFEIAGAGFQIYVGNPGGNYQGSAKRQLGGSASVFMFAFRSLNSIQSFGSELRVHTCAADDRVSMTFQYP